MTPGSEYRWYRLAGGWTVIEVCPPAPFTGERPVYLLGVEVPFDPDPAMMGPRIPTPDEPPPGPVALPARRLPARLPLPDPGRRGRRHGRGDAMTREEVLAAMSDMREVWAGSRGRVRLFVSDGPRGDMEPLLHLAIEDVDGARTRMRTIPPDDARTMAAALDAYLRDLDSWGDG